ncbi:MAG: prephenate dehydrogenase [Synergistaceae bacterium]|nr:prephenate dehydrogenase [Synergistaceae bacterium]MBQ9896329.1 prephenate dehydrogenase [Synergistaceae bacterium]
MNIGIIGLGLIGGSLARAVKTKTLHNVYALDIDQETMTFARISGAIDAKLDEDNLKDIDLLFIAIAPHEAIKWVEDNADKIAGKTILIDLCGVKRTVFNAMNKAAHDNNFVYIGGHPMAGTEHTGFVNSLADMFTGASMILTPPENFNDIKLLENLKAFFTDIGFANVTFTNPDEHDRIIAYTSQLAHVVSSSYVKSPDALKRRGFSAGSFKDMTRVARLDENVWTELFLDNKDYLINQVEILMTHINEYLEALKSNNAERLKALLKDGREKKLLAGGN